MPSDPSYIQIVKYSFRRSKSPVVKQPPHRESKKGEIMPSQTNKEVTLHPVQIVRAYRSTTIWLENFLEGMSLFAILHVVAYTFFMFLLSTPLEGLLLTILAVCTGFVLQRRYRPAGP